MIAPPCYIIDGPLMSSAARRDAVKARMVNDLVDSGTTDRDRARRLLYARSFLRFDIELMINEVLIETRVLLAQIAAVDAAMQEPAS
ncbi:hypothetical protein [Bradyrhizobium sp. SZCCHNRI2049]|uniref:hypothetical protein n=1 Tax=Bradyrhizobium sp. SZCCHNRI2049 TaxID=3057287 RepID=UPI002915DCD4|nr:hypothetical protein [Bradyrhizobium sp. SZCCHNRI2049]